MLFSALPSSVRLDTRAGADADLGAEPDAPAVDVERPAAADADVRGAADREQPARVAARRGPVVGIRVQVARAAAVERGIARRPAAGLRVVVAQAEAHEPGRRVLDPAGEADRQREARRGVGRDPAEAVAVDALDDRAVGSITTRGVPTWSAPTR